MDAVDSAPSEEVDGALHDDDGDAADAVDAAADDAGADADAVHHLA